MQFSLLLATIVGVTTVASILVQVGQWRKHARRTPTLMACDSGKAHLRLIPPNLWTLGHQCRVMKTIIWARPGLRRICFDLRNIQALDASTTALLRQALRQLTEAGVTVDFEGVGGRAVRALTRDSGFEVDIVGDTPTADSERTLH